MTGDDRGGWSNRISGQAENVVLARTIHGNVTIIGSERTGDERRCLVGVIPPVVECFQHRGQIDELAGAMTTGDTAVLCHVISGTGGVGKTQIAAHYADAAWRDGDVAVLVWVTASNRPAIVAKYAQAAAVLMGADVGDPEGAAERFLAWAQSTEQRWLVVLDDVAAPTDLRNLWPPRCRHGRTLVTTRRRDAALAGRGRVIEVGTFTPGQARAYLISKLSAHGRTDASEEVVGLAKDLGYLPLALSQAVAFMVDSGLDCAAYRRRLSDRRRMLSDVFPDDEALPDDQNATVAATWSLSIERADRLRPVGLALPMLELASMLDANGIPEAILRSGPALSYLSPERQVDAEDARDALRCLHRLNLVEHTPDDAYQTVRVHGLIQRATRDQLPSRDGLADACADALMHVWPEIERDTTLAQTLRTNTDALTVTADDALWRSDGKTVLFRAGRSLGEAGLINAAITQFEQLHATARRILGPDHPDTLTTRRNLARLRGDAGDPPGAVAALKELLTDELRILGPDHPDTLTTRANIARMQGEAGDPPGAVAALKELLTDRLRILGPDHPDTLATRRNLARWKGGAGDPASAVAALRELLTDELRILGPDHPDTLTTRANIARMQGEAGDPPGAVAALRELLTDELRILGPDHPDIFITRANIAYWRSAEGFGEAQVW